MRAAVREAVGGQIAISNVAPSHVPVNADGWVGEPGYARMGWRTRIRTDGLANPDTHGWVGEPRYAWTLSVAGGYNRRAHATIRMDPFGGWWV